mmetsp:Transcript_41943/g.91515  ORF Transcript_41943/g.91515 Transcript_41943/m.91515 type:complete len:223 (-) Transcript_41943:84-752(-)
MGQTLSGKRKQSSKRDESEPTAVDGGKDGGAGAIPGSGSASPGHGPGAREDQYSVEEALSLQLALRNAFAEESFQKLLRRAEAQYPRRGQRGHADQEKFTTQLQALLLHVYRTVLPRPPWCLKPGWDGYRTMMARMAAVSDELQIIKIKEDINAVLGLPRHTILRPPAEEPLFTPTPDGSGDVPAHAVPLVTDSDGDAAHEFWVEDKGGELRRVPLGPCAGA